MSFVTSLIIAFTFIGLMFMFGAVLIQQIGEDYLIKTTADVGVDIINDTTTLTSPITTIREIETDWSTWNIPYDLFFLFIWVSFLVLTIKSSFEAAKEGIFSFFGYILIGSLVLLLITSYIATFADWFLTEIFYNIFDDLSFSLPIFTFYMGNIGLINFVWFISLILINIIDKRFISRTGEVEE